MPSNISSKNRRAISRRRSSRSPCDSLARASSVLFIFFFFSSRRRHTRFDCDWSSDVCSSDLQWNGFLTSQPRGYLLQSYEWGELNRYLGGRIYRLGALDDGRMGRMGRMVEIGRASCRERV